MKNFVRRHAPLVIETIVVLATAEAFKAVVYKKK